MTALDRPSKGDCPRCGCADARILRTIARPGRPAVNELQCDGCNHVFAVRTDDLPIVRYPRIEVACPHCGSVATKVASSPRATGSIRVRYHKCLEEQCGKRFKSVEDV